LGKIKNTEIKFWVINPFFNKKIKERGKEEIKRMGPTKNSKITNFQPNASLNGKVLTLNPRFTRKMVWLKVNLKIKETQRIKIPKLKPNWEEAPLP